MVCIERFLFLPDHFLFDAYEHMKTVIAAGLKENRGNIHDFKKKYFTSSDPHHNISKQPR